MPLLVHEEDDRVYACPDCDAGGACYNRVSGDQALSRAVICRECGHECHPDDVIERENRSDPAAASRQAKPPAGSTAKALLEADPDAIGGD